MKRALLICLSLVLALVGWSAVGAEDGFYVIPSMKVLPKTGQTQKYGTGDDGVFEMGVAWPTPRFTDNGNGTVTDRFTGLMWMKHANCISYYPDFDKDNSPGDGKVTWVHALDFVAGINYGFYPLLGAGYSNWRLPNIRELHSLLDFGRTVFLLPEGYPFSGVQYEAYWSSTTLSNFTPAAFIMDFVEGTQMNMNKTEDHYVWPVRGGRQ